MNLVNEDGRRIVQKEGAALFFGGGAYDRIVQRGAVESDGYAVEHSGFPDLSRPGDKYGAKHFRKLGDGIFCMSSDIHRLLLIG